MSKEAIKVKIPLQYQPNLITQTIQRFNNRNRIFFQGKKAKKNWKPVFAPLFTFLSHSFFGNTNHPELTLYQKTKFNT